MRRLCRTALAETRLDRSCWVPAVLSVAFVWVLSGSITQPATASPVSSLAHRWGETVVTDRPEAVVTLSFTGIDTMLALGLTPLAYRAWFAGDERGLWPWSAPHLPADAESLVIRGEIDAEAVARLKPDFIEAMYSGISRAQYAALSLMAPVLPAKRERGDFGATWVDMLRGVGAATGRSAEAEAVVADVEAQFEAIKAAHPDWQGRTAVVALPQGPTIFSASDPRMRLFTRLGFRPPPAAERLALGSFSFKLDRELTTPLEADVVIWLDFGAGFEDLQSNPLRRTLRTVREGREIAADPLLSAALSYASPLSIPYALDRLVPLLEAALDGDPATPVAGARDAGLAR